MVLHHDVNHRERIVDQMGHELDEREKYRHVVGPIVVCVSHQNDYE